MMDENTLFDVMTSPGGEIIHNALMENGRLKAEVSALRAELDALKDWPTEWQPVDTAPIDRPLEALLTARRSADGRWYYADVRPTAWRPLPPAPNEAEEVQP